ELAKKADAAENPKAAHYFHIAAKISKHTEGYVSKNVQEAQSLSETTHHLVSAYEQSPTSDNTRKLADAYARAIESRAANSATNHAMREKLFDLAQKEELDNRYADLLVKVSIQDKNYAQALEYGARWSDAIKDDGTYELEVLKDIDKQSNEFDMTKD